MLLCWKCDKELKGNNEKKSRHVFYDKKYPRLCKECADLVEKEECDRAYDHEIGGDEDFDYGDDGEEIKNLPEDAPREER
jgi:hypothetical protein